MGKGKAGRDRVFSVVPTDSTRGDRHKSKYQKFHSNINLNHFHFEGGQTTGEALWQALKSPSMKIFFPKLDTALPMLWERRVGLGGLQRSLPTPAGPWLCGTNRVKVMQISQLISASFPPRCGLRTEHCCLSLWQNLLYVLQKGIYHWTHDKRDKLPSDLWQSLCFNVYPKIFWIWQVLSPAYRATQMTCLLCFLLCFFPTFSTEDSSAWVWIDLQGKELGRSEAGPQ